MATIKNGFPLRRITDEPAFQRFFHKFVRGSYPLFIAAVAALVWANLDPEHYHDFWHAEFSWRMGCFTMSDTLAHWIDDALMVLFFFLVGLEIKREILVGGLSSPKQAVLPIAAAAGGMILPALIYAGFTFGTPMVQGWGIPMATDIAFSLAILSILGDRIPTGLKIFLSAFAIADDLGAVMVIALFYTQDIQVYYLAAAGLGLLILLAVNLLWIRATLVYVFLGIVLWYAVLGSGVHATVAGVLLAMFIPARGKYDTDTFVRTVRQNVDAMGCEENSCGHSILLNRNHLNAVQAIHHACLEVETPLQRLEHNLQSWIALVVLPLFALANAGLVLKGMEIGTAALSPVTLGIFFGLLVGKPLGIFFFTFVTARLFKAPLPGGVNWPQVFGVGLLGGIGFTMSLFIAGLSFSDPLLSEYAKLGIIAASVLAGLFGLMVLYRWSRFSTGSAEAEKGRRKPLQTG